MREIKILLVEDDPDYSRIIKGGLELKGGYDVCVAGNGTEGYKAYKTYRPDLIVSDVEMPEMSGLEMVKCIRGEDPAIPIILASAKTGSKDLVKGYRLVIDDYIKKPYLAEELFFHIEAILRRTAIRENPIPVKTTLHAIGAYLFDAHARLLKWREEAFVLTARDAQVLEMLCEQKGETVKREDILQRLWTKDDYYTSRSLDVFVSKLRKYLKKDTSVRIQTVRGKGLRLIC
ncbi:MAG: response regulator transcription factor [Tannerellaceae bacterium]|jgi:DNA-binding response OmpR family regulator|nr:response regulator transcription factor [Tannerellaceae bacterium]